MSGGEIMILGKLALTFGVLLGVPLRELVLVRRLLRARDEADARRVEAPDEDSSLSRAAPGAAGGPRGTVHRER
jgi:hypothetical protein